MAVDRPRGAHFEISVDGKPRSYRDTKAMAIEGAEYFKQRHPQPWDSTSWLKTFRALAAPWERRARRVPRRTATRC